MAKDIKLILSGINPDNQVGLQQLKSADIILARGEYCRLWLENNISRNVIPFFLQDGQSLEQWQNSFFETLKGGETIAYVTLVSPISCDIGARQLAHAVKKEHLSVYSGKDLSSDLLFFENPFDKNPTVIIDGIQLEKRHFPPFSMDNDVIIIDPCRAVHRDQMVDLLRVIYTLDQEIFVLDGTSGDLLLRRDQLLNLQNYSEKEIEAIFIPSSSTNSSLESFQEVIAHLRAPEDGCPWDKKQTHSSLRPYLLEETYEALESLDREDANSLKEELGDLLLQILLHAQIASENREFRMSDVLEGINKKIVYRHPHVFKDWQVEDEKEVTQNWEALKKLERTKESDESPKGMLDGVPVSFPALAQAQAIQDRAARVGFDWPEIKPVMDKVLEELEEVNTAPNELERAKELGDLLFAIVNLIRWYKVDAESVLRLTNLKFRKRFAYIENEARKSGKEMSRMTLEEMDVLWEEAKAFDD